MERKNKSGNSQAKNFVLVIVPSSIIGESERNYSYFTLNLWENECFSFRSPKRNTNDTTRTTEANGISVV